MTPELKAAIESAYRVFSRYRLGGSVIVCNCNCCVKPEDERLLIRTPLRDICCALLGEYTNSAHGFDQHVADELRYFLPRYFELIAAGELPTSSLEELVLRQLGVADYRANWPNDERDAVDRYFTTLFAEQLASPVIVRQYDRTSVIDCDGADVALTLQIVGNAGGDVAALLNHWETTRTREADIRIADFALKLDPLNPDGSYSDWDARSAATRRALVRFISTPEMRQRIEDATLAEKQPLAGELLSLAEQTIATLAYRAAHHD